MIRLFLIILFSLVYWIGEAQKIEIKGKVVDKESSIPLNKVSISIGKFGTLSNVNGFFSITIDKAYFEKFKLTVTYVGYETFITYNNPEFFYNIKMEVSKSELPEIFVSANADRIIKKAIEKIPVNYPTDTHLMEGLLRIYRTESDSQKVYRFFKSDAVLSVLQPSYLQKRADTKVRVIQNKTIYLKPNELPTDSTQWVGAYKVDNFIHQKADFVDIDKMNKCKYHIMGKTILQEKKVWIISFESKSKKQISGTLFVDTANYVIIAAQYSRYNIPTRIDLLKRRIYKAIDEISYDIVFQNIGNRWFLYKKSTKSTYSSADAIHYYLFTDFVCTKVDTNILASHIFKKDEYVKSDSKDNEIIKNAPGSNWIIYDSLFSSLEDQKAIRYLQIPLIKMPNINTSYNKEETPFYKRKTFLENTFMRSSLSLNHINIRSTSNSKGNLGAGVSIGVRVHKNTYLHLVVSLNFGDSNRIISSKSSLVIMRSFNLTNSIHPLYLAPLIGISVAELAKKSKHFEFLYNVVAGATLSYPIIPKLAPFFNITYDEKIKDHGKLASYYFTPINYSIGFYYSLN